LLSSTSPYLENKKGLDMAFITNSRFRIAAIVAGSMVAGILIGGTAMAYQRHMWNALHSLQNAEAQLQMASPDKGGYRVNAINLVNQAISAVQAGIAAGAE
jgi:hypothetical protein